MREIKYETNKQRQESGQAGNRAFGNSVNKVRPFDGRGRAERGITNLRVAAMLRFGRGE